MLRKRFAVLGGGGGVAWGRGPSGSLTKSGQLRLGKAVIAKGGGGGDHTFGTVWLFATFERVGSVTLEPLGVDNSPPFVADHDIGHCTQYPEDQA